MKKLVAILVALSCSAQAQVNLTVIADTNRVIRTNFSLVRSQITDLSSATFAISNVTSLQGALDGKLATNGDAFALTNFPALLLRTNGSAASLTNFPSEILRTNGDGSGLTNIYVDLTTVLPSYAGNSGKVLAVASGETNVEWTAISNTVTDASTLTNFPAIILQTNSADGSFPAFLLRTNGSASGLTGILPVLRGGTGATNAMQALTNFTILRSNGGGSYGVNVGSVNVVDATGVIIGAAAANSGNGVAIGPDARGISSSVAIGVGAASTNGGAALGQNAKSTQGGAIGQDSSTIIGGAIGHAAVSSGGGAAGRLANSVDGFAGGQSSKTTNGFAGGQNAESVSGAAIGKNAKATQENASQIGEGTNASNNTIQFMSAGTITTNEWATLAALSTYPTTNISVVGTNNTNTLVFSNGILTSVTSP